MKLFRDKKMFAKQINNEVQKYNDMKQVKKEISKPLVRNAGELGFMAHEIMSRALR